MKFLFEDDLLNAVTVCVLPALLVGTLWLLWRRFISLACPQCKDYTLMRFDGLATWRPVFAIYACRRCSKTYVKVFHLK